MELEPLTSKQKNSSIQHTNATTDLHETLLPFYIIKLTVVWDAS
jgi:hypothetical protein